MIKGVKKFKYLFFVFIFSIFFLVFGESQNVYANNNIETSDIETSNIETSIQDNINSSLEVYDFGEVDTVLTKENDIGLFSGLTFEGIIKGVITGEISLKPSDIYTYVLDEFSRQYKNLAVLFFDLFIIGIASAFIQNLTNSVKPKSTAAMGNYVCFIVLIHLLTKSLYDIMDIVVEFLNYIGSFTEAMLPIVLGSMAFSGYVGTAYFVQPCLVALTYIISSLFKNVLVNFIFVIAIIEIINGVTSKELLSSFCDIGNKIIKWSLRTITVGYMTVLSLIKIGGPISDNLIKRGTKSVVSAIPVVGNTLGSAVDTVGLVADTTSSAILFALVLFCILYSLSYIISLVSYNILFSISTVVLEPITDKSIVKAIKCLTKYIGYFLSVFGVSMFLFIFSVIVVLRWGDWLVWFMNI